MIENKATIYNTPTIYKTGAGGGGDTSIFNILLEQYQGSRGSPGLESWPTGVEPLSNRVTTQIIYLNSFIGKKIKVFIQNNSYEIGLVDGTSSGSPYKEFVWNGYDTIETTIEYGTITLSMRKKDNTNLLPNETPIYLQLLDS